MKKIKKKKTCSMSPRETHRFLHSNALSIIFLANNYIVTKATACYITKTQQHFPYQWAKKLVCFCRVQFPPLNTDTPSEGSWLGKSMLFLPPHQSVAASPKVWTEEFLCQWHWYVLMLKVHSQHNVLIAETVPLLFCGDKRDKGSSSKR